MADALRDALEREVASHYREHDAPLALVVLWARLKAALPADSFAPGGSVRERLGALPEGLVILDDPEQPNYDVVVRRGEEATAQRHFEERRRARAAVAMIGNLPAQLLCAFCTPSDVPVYVTARPPIRCRFGADSREPGLIPVGDEYRCPHIHIHQSRRCDLADANELADSLRAWAAEHAVDLEGIVCGPSPHDQLFLLATGDRLSAPQAMSATVKKATHYLDALLAIEHFHSQGARIPGVFLCMTMELCGDYWSAKEVFDLFPHYAATQGSRAYNMLISKAGGFKRAIRIYGEMINKGLVPTQHSYVALLKTCRNQNDFGAVIDTLRANEIVPTSAILSAALAHPAGFEETMAAFQHLIELGARPHLGAFHILLNRTKKSEHIELLLAMMEQARIAADRIVIGILIRKSRSFEDARRIFEQGRANGIPLDARTAALLADKASTEKEREAAAEISQSSGQRSTCA
jgi:hypothetical protein